MATSYTIQGVELSTPNTLYAATAFQEATDWNNQHQRDAAKP